MTVEYTVIEKVPSAEAFCHLRVAAGMSPRPLEGARAGLPHSCYGVHILWQETPIAMGRIVGDGAINFDIVDVAVDPALANPQSLARISCQEKSVVQMATRLTARSSLC